MICPHYVPTDGDRKTRSSLDLALEHQADDGT
jgi:hypothetical protein